MQETIKLDKCPLTGLQIENGEAWMERHFDRKISYRLHYNNDITYLTLCLSLYNYLTKGKGEGYEEFTQKSGLFFGEVSKNDYQDLFKNVIHYNCPLPAGRSDNRHISMLDIAKQVEQTGKYPITRKDKSQMILNWLSKNQAGEGISFHIANSFKGWTQCYMPSEEVFKFYLRELDKQGKVEFKGTTVTLTFEGLDYVEKIETNLILNDETISYDVALSFAGEQREYVEKVASQLKEKGISVFYDNYEQVDLWGKDLYSHLNDIYKNKCQYCIIFISKEYANKLWTQHELKSAQTRAFRENMEYILPVRIDDTELPGLNETVGYIDARNITPEGIAKLAKLKIEKNSG